MGSVLRKYHVNTAVVNIIYTHNSAAVWCGSIKLSTILLVVLLYVYTGMYNTCMCTTAAVLPLLAPTSVKATTAAANKRRT